MSSEEKVTVASGEKLSRLQLLELDQAKKALEVEKAKYMISAPVKSYKLTPEEILARYGPPGHKKSSSLDGVRFMQRKEKEEETVGRKPGSKDKKPRRNKNDKRVNESELLDQQERVGGFSRLSVGEAKQFAKNVADIIENEPGESVAENPSNDTKSYENVIETSENVTQTSKNVTEVPKSVVEPTIVEVTIEEASEEINTLAALQKEEYQFYTEQGIVPSSKLTPEATICPVITDTYTVIRNELDNLTSKIESKQQSIEILKQQIEIEEGKLIKLNLAKSALQLAEKALGEIDE